MDSATRPSRADQGTHEAARPCKFARVDSILFGASDRTIYLSMFRVFLAGLLGFEWTQAFRVEIEPSEVEQDGVAESRA